MPTESLIERCHFLFCQDLAYFDTKARIRGRVPGQSVCSVVSARSALTSPQPAGHKDQVYSCDQCGHEANVTVDLKKHKAEVHKNSAYTCNQWGLEDAAPEEAQEAIIQGLGLLLSQCFFF